MISVVVSACFGVLDKTQNLILIFFTAYFGVKTATDYLPSKKNGNNVTVTPVP
jgi:hypothetical protein